MATKKRNLFLYLAIACFVGIIAIFVFDGYVGIYDTVYVTAGEYEQEIGPDFWQGQPSRYPYPYNIGARWGDPVHFRYEIDNRRFSTYATTVEASVWQSNEKVIDLLSQDVSLSNFDKATMSWTLTAEELEKAGLEIGEYTVKIRRGEEELGQGIILDFRTSQIEIVPPSPGRG